MSAKSRWRRHWLIPTAEITRLVSGDWPLSADPDAMGWTCLPPITARTADAAAGSVRAARDFTTATLHRWGVTERNADIALVVSELLTNALRHGLPRSGDARLQWPIRLGMRRPGRCVLCAVADPSDVVPVPTLPGRLAESGRGLRIICALSDRWGYTSPGAMGKIVWAIFSTQLASPIPGHPLARYTAGPGRASLGPATADDATAVTHHAQAAARRTAT